MGESINAIIAIYSILTNLKGHFDYQINEKSMNFDFQIIFLVYLFE
jgi:hypothetical protein